MVCYDWWLWNARRFCSLY
uniref:Uncharacterized protein n=1 Tax=Arundo donax TaxID=35708 RepID=A0A0A9AE26_ARUDO